MQYFNFSTTVGKNYQSIFSRWFHKRFFLYDFFLLKDNETIILLIWVYKEFCGINTLKQNLKWILKAAFILLFNYAFIAQVQ
jgi:hypothetical protein